MSPPRRGRARWSSRARRALAAALPESHNSAEPYQGPWRVRHLDLVALDYAARACRRHGGLDALALTHVDSLIAAEGQAQVALRYEGIAKPYALGGYRDLRHQEKLTRTALEAVPVLEPLAAERVVPLIERALGAPARIVARGPRREDREPG